MFATATGVLFQVWVVRQVLSMSMTHFVMMLSVSHPVGDKKSYLCHCSSESKVGPLSMCRISVTAVQRVKWALHPCVKHRCI